MDIKSDIKSDDVINIESAKQIRLKVGNSVIVLEQDKITIDGDMVMENCKKRPDLKTPSTAPTAPEILTDQAPIV